MPTANCSYYCKKDFSVEKSLILDQRKIEQKIVRIAYQIAEFNYGEEELYIVGIEAGGYTIAQEIIQQLKKINHHKLSLCKLSIDKVDPVNGNISLDINKEDLKDTAVILVDDVLESGRTMMYAAKFLLDQSLKKLGTAVLVDRMHPKFPIRADYVGLTLSTTLQNHISFEAKGSEYSVYLS